MSSNGEDMGPLALDTSWLDERLAVEAKRVKRHTRRRKTLSPSKVTTFMDGIDLANSDPMSWPAIPCDDRVGRGTGDADHVVPKTVSPTPVMSAGAPDRDKADSLWAVSSDVAALVADEPTLPVSRKPSRPLGVLGTIHNRNLSTEKRVLEKKTRAVSIQETCGIPVLEQLENLDPTTTSELDKNIPETCSSNMGGTTITLVPTITRPRQTSDEVDSIPTTFAREQKGSRTSRRRSIVMPSEAKPFMDAAHDDMASPKHNGDSATSGEKLATLPSEDRRGVVEGINKPTAVTATSCLSRPLAVQRGWQGNSGETTKMLVRAYYAAPEGSQRARRVAARLFCLTGYCLLPVTPEDARLLCQVAGDSLDWGLEETDKPELKSNPLRRKTRDQKRQLVLRIKPLFDMMEKAAKTEKLAVEKATGIVARKAVPDGYFYEDKETGEAVDPLVYKTKYTKHVCTVSTARRQKFATGFLASRTPPITSESSVGKPKKGSTSATNEVLTAPWLKCYGAPVIDSAKDSRYLMRERLISSDTKDSTLPNASSTVDPSAAGKDAPKSAEHTPNSKEDLSTWAAQKGTGRAQSAREPPSVTATRGEGADVLVGTPEIERDTADLAEHRAMEGSKSIHLCGSLGSSSTVASFGAEMAHVSCLTSPSTNGLWNGRGASESSAGASDNAVAGAVLSTSMQGNGTWNAATLGAKSEENNTPSKSSSHAHSSTALGKGPQVINLPAACSTKPQDDETRQDSPVRNHDSLPPTLVKREGLMTAISLPSASIAARTEGTSHDASTKDLGYTTMRAMEAELMPAAEKNDHRIISGDITLDGEIGDNNNARGGRTLRKSTHDEADAVTSSSLSKQIFPVKTNTDVVTEGSSSRDGSFDLSPLKFPSRGELREMPGWLSRVPEDRLSASKRTRDCSEFGQRERLETDMAIISISPASPPTSDHELHEEISVLEARLFAAFDDLLHQYHADVAQAITKHEMKKNSEIAASISDSQSTVAPDEFATDLETLPDQGTGVDMKDMFSASSSFLEVEVEAKETGQATDVKGSARESPVVNAGESTSANSSSLLPPLDLRLSVDDLFGSTSDVRGLSAAAGVAGPSESGRRASLSTTLASHRSRRSKKPQLWQNRTEGVAEDAHHEKDKGHSLGKLEEASETLEAGKGSGVMCHICWRRKCDVLLRPCNHSACRVCTDKLQSQADQSGEPLSCPWDRQLVHGIHSHAPLRV